VGEAGRGGEEGREVIRRLWVLLCCAWAAAFLANGATKVDGIAARDLELAAAPWVIGWLIARAARFVVTGSPLRLDTEILPASPHPRRSLECEPPPPRPLLYLLPKQ
jgi:hypothetical protein